MRLLPFWFMRQVRWAAVVLRQTRWELRLLSHNNTTNSESSSVTSGSWGESSTVCVASCKMGMRSVSCESKEASCAKWLAGRRVGGVLLPSRTAGPKGRIKRCVRAPIYGAQFTHGHCDSFMFVMNMHQLSTVRMMLLFTSSSSRFEPPIMVVTSMELVVQ